MKPSTPLVYSLIFVALLTGLTIGYSISPNYPESMSQSGSMDLGTADRWLDRRYIDAMAAHHRGAMLLAEQAKQYSTRQEIQALASEILANEPKLIDELYTWKKNWYNDSQKASDPVSPKLSTSDEKFDLRFLNALIAHHQAGIEMTREVRLKSSNKDVLNNADAVETFLSGSKLTLQEWRKSWYNIQ